MITGFNTDVEHGGVTYHVQTEDKGLKSPLILSLVYVGGTILASKRTPYEDLIAAGFDEGKLAERLTRQHKLICAAIHAGRIEDLKRQTERESVTRAARPSEAEHEQAESLQAEPSQAEALQSEPLHAEPSRAEPLPSEPPAAEPVQAAPPEPEPEPSEQAEPPPQEEEDESDIIQLGSLADYMPPAVPWKPPPPPEFPQDPFAPPPEQVDYSRVVDPSAVAVDPDELQISLLEEKKFVAGEFVKIRLHVRRGEFGAESIQNAAVTLKVLGSSFRPLIFNGKTGADGVAVFYAMLPYFTSGRAAILASVLVKGERAELRRVIHQVGA